MSSVTLTSHLFEPLERSALQQFLSSIVGYLLGRLESNCNESLFQGRRDDLFVCWERKWQHLPINKMKHTYIANRGEFVRAGKGTETSSEGSSGFPLHFHPSIFYK